jgi:hypothetical protein
MQVENLIPHGFVTQLHCPPRTYNERSLKEVYLVLSERFRYSQFQILPGGQGATLKEGEQRTCEIYMDRLVIKEQPTQSTFEEYMEQVAPIVQEVQHRLKQPLWIFQQSNLRFLIPFDVPVNTVLKEQLFHVTDAALERFGRPILGLCMRVEFPPLPEDPTQVQLRVEPYFRDPKMLYLELSTRFLQPLQEPQDLGPRLRSAYDFLREKCTGFLQEVFSKKEG